MEHIQTFIDQLLIYPYLRQAFFTSIFVGITCGIVGCFIILRGMALMGDAISHAVLPGVVISYMLGISFFIGAMITGMITALLIGFISDKSKMKEDASIGVMFTGMFALGVVMITAMRGTSVDLWHILFGNVLAVSAVDMISTLIIMFIVLITTIIFYRPLLLSTFDKTMARASGLPVKWIHYLLMLLLSLVTVASLQTVGIILVVAMLITPGSTAYLLTDRFSIMIVLSAIFGTVSAVIGLFFSVMYDVSSGGAIVLTATALFTLAFLFGSNQGIIVLLFKRRKTKTA